MTQSLIGVVTNRRWFSRLVVAAPFVFCVITFEPIEVQTRAARQNDRLNLSFVKDSCRKNGQKLSKTAIRAGRWRWFPIDDDICTTFLKSLWSILLIFILHWNITAKHLTLYWKSYVRRTLVLIPYLDSQKAFKFLFLSLICKVSCKTKFEIISAHWVRIYFFAEQKLGW